jgi:fructoselysine 6-phosphate deglycase
MEINELVTEIISKKRERGGIKNMYFVACGGSLGGFYPALYLMEHVSKEIRTGFFTSNEFVHAPPDACGPASLVLACSMRGTSETIEAVKTAKKRGATTVVFYVEESDLARNADYAIPYESISLDETRIENTNASLQLRFCFELLHQLENYPFYRNAMTAFDMLNDLYLKAKTQCQSHAKKFAEECKNESVIYVMGGGPSMGAAYIFSICNLMEMQWIHSPTVNTGELLHGPFEPVDKTLPIFFLLSEGRTRPVDMRALKFLQTYGEKLYILDAEKIGIEKIAEPVAEYFNHSIFSSLLNNLYLRELAAAKNHDYKSRRYMWKVPY